jgi:hypothetical protein
VYCASRQAIYSYCTCILHLPASTSQLHYAGPLPNRFGRLSDVSSCCNRSFFVFTGPKAVGWVAGSDAVVDSGGRAMEYESCVRLSFAAYTLFVL